ncbi:MAG TPA: SAM-dependent methyltransferase [Parvularcula sp.]|nr:SAM-dependent methyltransferase [Parvularcula sp.]HBS32052.1 SAM-dependent methyltransferase [Parvularcula sp.]HBS33847.1 SAM-dependent methyltransferase [Parvularcula sp.]
MAALYDTIGLNYSALRRPDPRIAAVIESALKGARSIVNVGAGTGSYEPAGRRVTAIERSFAMILKRPGGGAGAVQASAEALPFPDDSFDAAMAILTIHHWPDRQTGLREMRRVSRGPVVLLTFDPAARPWLTDYLPALSALDEAAMPRLDEYEQSLGPVRISPVLVPHDCRDGFLHAYWRRPQAYLDARIRSGSSSFWAIGDAAAGGIAALRRDLESGDWRRRYRHIETLDAYDAGYRLVVAP